MPENPDLDAIDQRILGSLLEKQVTVPASYPLTVNALRSACNQSSSRDPVVDYDVRLLEERARSLKDRGLLRIVWSDGGRRTLKYHQTLSETLDLADDERALLTVLLLRGPQAPGELRSRTERLHTFADREAVGECLRRMAAREAPLVRELERRPGQQDRRWVHLLGEEPAPVPDAARPDDDRAAALRGGSDARDDRVRATYSAVATAYADQFTDELPDLPFEAWLLRHVATLAGDRPMVEVGCGPGHVTHFLAEAGADAQGIDLTPAMVAEARRRYPQGRYDVGDLRRLMRPAHASGWGAVLAWYSLIHLTPAELPEAVAALTRPIAPGGHLLVALHAGADRRSPESWFDIPVDLDLVLHTPGEVRAAMEDAGLAEIEWYLRGPHTARGEISERLYVLGRKATSA